MYALGDDVPHLDDDVFVSDLATVIGNVYLAKGASVWPNAVIRGDNGERIEVGARSNIQDGAVLHTDRGVALHVGEDVSVGHQAMLHGCCIGSGSLIGIQAVILNGATIGKNSLVAAGAVVTERMTFPDNSVIVGAPAKVVRELSEAEVEALHDNAADYVERSRRYLAKLRCIG
jgi:carbonic anhydrase/acetyltransferase-like protein (isoleucine patch superfamily)